MVLSKFVMLNVFRLYNGMQFHVFVVARLSRLLVSGRARLLVARRVSFLSRAVLLRLLTVSCFPKHPRAFNGLPVQPIRILCRLG